MKRVMIPCSAEYVSVSDMNVIQIITLATKSCIWYIAGGFTQIARRPERVDNYYNIKDRGIFKVFRDSESNRKCAGEPVTLVFGFRLKLIGSSKLLHWLFQRFCIFTTPFWSGLPGFKVKLWLVDPKTKNYLGIYDWRGEKEAQTYINFLLPVLKFCSISGTVWHTSKLDISFADFLSQAKTPEE